MHETMTRHIIIGMQILHEMQWLKNQAVVVEKGQIKAIIPADMISHHQPAKIYHFPQAYYLCPGLIDLHIHGAAKHDVMDGSIEGLHTISRHLASEGVTGYLATTMTTSVEQLENVLRIIPAAIEHSDGAKILGIHLEGPFLSKEKMGAQNSKYLLDPDISLLRHWQKIALNHIKLMTIAPELPGSLALINAAKTMGMIISIGHTNATYDETSQAIQAGSQHATHLFNAMRNLHQREPGAIGALLTANEVSAELIVDGIHLHPAVIDIALRCKGKENLILVSDAMRAKCLGDGQFDLGGQSVNVIGGKASLSDGTLAGSTLRLPQALKNITHYTHCSLADAIAMASLNPTRVLGLDNKGSIAVGKDADLMVMNADLEVVFTMRDGREIFTHAAYA